jgi:hypothetical protein
LTFTPDANSDYFLFGMAVLDNSTTSSDTRAKLENNAGTAIAMDVTWEPQDTTDNITVFGFARESFGASPTSQSYRIDYNSEVGTATAGIQNARLLALKKDTADQFAETTAEANTTSSTFSNTQQLIFTPATAGDYLLLASAEYQVDVAGADIGIRMEHSGTAYSEMQTTTQDTTTWRTWGCVIRKNLAASSQTINLQFQSEDNVSTVSIRNRRLMAIRLSTLDNNYYAESLTRSSVASTTVTDKTTLTQTTQAVNHLSFWTGILDDSSNSSSSLFRAELDAVDEVVSDEEPNENSDEWSHVVFRVHNLSGASHTWKTQFNSEGANSTGIDESVIAVLQLDATPVGGGTYPGWQGGGWF